MNLTHRSIGFFKALFARRHIPKGLYCYEPLGISYPDPKGPPVFHTKPCRYFDKGQCKLIGPLDDMDELIIWDQVKICGIKENIKESKKDIRTRKKMQARLDDTRC